MSDRKKLGGALRWILPLAVVLAAVAFKALASGGDKQEADAIPIPVRTVKPTRADLVKTLELNAHIESDSMVTVLPMVSGILQELSVDVGQAVKKDQVLARIDAARYELQLQQAEAAWTSAKSSYDRVAQLYKSGATTQQNYDQAKAQYDAYASQYELARLQLGYATVRSPVDGVVLLTHLTVGSIASPERPLLTIGNLDELIVRARIPERYYRAFSEGQETMPVQLVGPDGYAVPGTIRNISPFVSAETKNFETVVALAGDTSAFRPGMFVSVVFELHHWDNVPVLPFEALSGSGSLWYVEDGVAKAAPFIPDRASDTAFAVPDEWLGRDVIVEGHYFTREGSPVTVVSGGGLK